MFQEIRVITREKSLFEILDYGIFIFFFRFKKVFKTETPKIKYLGIKLTKKVEDLHPENHKTLIKEIQDDSKKRHPMFLEEYC